MSSLLQPSADEVPLQVFRLPDVPGYHTVGWLLFLLSLAMFVVGFPELAKGNPFPLPLGAYFMWLVLPYGPLRPWVYTAVTRDRIIASNGLWKRAVSLDDVLSADRPGKAADGFVRRRVRIQLRNGHTFREWVTQQLTHPDSDALIALVNRLVAERRGADQASVEAEHCR